MDDIIIAGPNKPLITEVTVQLQGLFKLKVLGDLKYFLGLEIAKSVKGIHLNQRKYTLELLEDTGFTNCKPAKIPMDPGLQLDGTVGEVLEDLTQFRRLLGRLMYLTISRPDIIFPINKLSQFMQTPRTPHLQALHQVLQYLKAAPAQGLFFSANSNSTVTAYVDSDWGNCKDTRRSTTGFCIYLGSSLICWKSKKQPTVARSSAEAEYRALASLTSELLWLRQLLRVFQITLDSTMIMCDNKSAIALAENPTSNDGSKHIDIDCHFIRQYVHSGFIKLVYLPTHQQLADIFTKALPHCKFSVFLPKLGLLDIYAPNLRGSITTNSS
ncbi:uncharacterized protein LOC114397394 [Glycine soja]|uniref:uncharacterized mitochondrial protein AtMg00810-like n=1 Tax=Glycine max TaxID=3847 RepID=UPI0007193EC5|nr:uncharacterized mitochondrial protein AtMg00810-like [Glycine max]XP_028215242.1 uncharacterized protein LOC114397394 [Glycine soja]|eukprot:XP_014626203.1 uncharacterized protein LOC106797038 [Glycine max]